MINNKNYEARKMNSKAEQKTARKIIGLERFIKSSGEYMSNLAVVRGNLPSFNSSWFTV